MEISVISHSERPRDSLRIWEAPGKPLWLGDCPRDQDHPHIPLCLKSSKIAVKVPTWREVNKVNHIYLTSARVEMLPKYRKLKYNRNKNMSK